MDAVIALSALYERPPIYDSKPLSLLNNPANVRHGYHEEALVWYSRSLIALQRQINQGVADLTISMTSCVLFKELATRRRRPFKILGVANGQWMEIGLQSIQTIASRLQSNSTHLPIMYLLAVFPPISTRITLSFFPPSQENDLLNS